MLTIGSLCAGVGGLELGLEMAGLGPTLWQVEQDAKCRSVLARHWPEVVRHEDVCVVGADVLVPVDIICGGFPCQNLSSANVRTRHGLAGDKSGLWREFRRVVARLPPRFVVVENVAVAWRAWVPVVRRDLWDLGYSTVPVQLSAADVGAPFERARCFVIAKSYGNGESVSAINAQMAELPSLARVRRQDWGRPAPRALGVADGIPNVMDRLQMSGNAVVPRCSEVIGHIIKQLSGVSDHG